MMPSYKLNSLTEDFMPKKLPSFYADYVFKNGKKVKNRLSLAPLTNCQSNINGTLGDDEKKWLIQNARGGFGLVMTCASYVMPTGKAWVGELGIHDNYVIPGLQDLTKILKSYGSLNIIQIFHGGMRCPSAITGQQPASASECDLPFLPNFEKPRALTVAEIEQIIDRFADATQRAYQAGFDGVEIHGANGYLITQFISQATNFRTDHYGGSLENRARLARQILKACRQKVPYDFLIGMRLSPEDSRFLEGLDLNENVQIAQWLVKDGVDFIDLSSSDFFASSLKYPEQPKPIIAFFRKKLGPHVPIIAGGGVKVPSQAEEVMAMGATFIYLGKIAIGHTDWPIKAMNQNFVPTVPPYTINYLRQHGISERFIGYMSELLVIGKR